MFELVLESVISPSLLVATEAGIANHVGIPSLHLCGMDFIRLNDFATPKLVQFTLGSFNLVLRRWLEPTSRADERLGWFEEMARPAFLWQGGLTLDYRLAGFAFIKMILVDVGDEPKPHGCIAMVKYQTMILAFCGSQPPANHLGV